MKSLFVLTAVVTFSLSSLGATLWNCSGQGIENLSVSADSSALSGNVQWDCWPGGGICTQNARLQVVSSDNGKIVYGGRGFRLTVLETPSENGTHRAHISAIDTTDGKDMGRGLSINQYVGCTKGR
jgi:hypothetical protein